MLKTFFANPYMLQHMDVKVDDVGNREMMPLAVRLWTNDLQLADEYSNKPKSVGDGRCAMFLNDSENEEIEMPAEVDAADVVPEILQDMRMKLRDASHRALTAMAEMKDGDVGKDGKLAIIEANCLCKSIISTIELAVLPYKGNNRARKMARFVLTNIVYNASCDDDLEDQKRRLGGERLELVMDVDDHGTAMNVLLELVGKEGNNQTIANA